MFGYSTLRDTWNTQWGPAPVLALHGTEERTRPVSLPGQSNAKPGRGTAA